MVKNNIIIFKSANCHGCKVLDNFLKNEYPNLEFEKVDVESIEGIVLSERLGVMSLPTMIRFVGNIDYDNMTEEDFRVIGFDKQKVRELLYRE